MSESMRFQVSLVVVCYLTPFWVSLAVKELYGRKTRKEDKRPRYLLYFDFIAGFNNHSVGEEIIPESK